MFLCSRGKRNGEELLQSAANAGTKEHKNKSPCPYVLKHSCSYVLLPLCPFVFALAMVQKDDEVWRNIISQHHGLRLRSNAHQAQAM